MKNHEFLVDVAKILEDRGVAFQMLFVGDGSLRDELEARVDMLELTGHVRFLGVREDVADILRQSDVLVMPSHHEGLPVALVEAQATGLPCLVSESVTSDADLGLGLLHFISIDNASSWADALVEGMPKRKESSKINAAFEARGYNVEGALHELLALYRPQDS